MYLTIDSFGQFLTDEKNVDLIEAGIYEIIVWDSSNNKWKLHQVSDEDEMDDFVHYPAVDDDVLNALREENPYHPICVLEEDVYTNNVPQGTHDIPDEDDSLE